MRQVLDVLLVQEREVLILEGSGGSVPTLLLLSLSGLQFGDRRTRRLPLMTVLIGAIPKVLIAQLPLDLLNTQLLLHFLESLLLLRVLLLLY